jgi:osmotically-inducible protein OsmY
MPERWEYRNREEVRDYDRDYDRDYERERNRRGPIERAGDEVRSWFGDHEAARRRRLDETRGERDRSWTDRERHPVERTWDRTRETVRDMTDRDRDGRRGLSEWNDEDRPTTSTHYESVNRSYERDWDAPDYRGRGPRGYQRSDARMFEDICDRLTVDPRIDASDVEVEVKAAEVTLRGSVRSRDEKRYAEDVVEHVMGVRDVNNHLKVTRPDQVIGTARSDASSTLALSDTPPPPPGQRK